MSVRVLIVDDSRFFRRRVTEMLESDARIKVIGQAENGSEAIQMASRLKPDIITMDIEMPIMDGITATKRILATQKLPILMFSSLTTEGAQATLDALDAGAVDYLPKRFEDISNDKMEARRQLCERIISVVNSYSRAKLTPPSARVTPIKPGIKPSLPGVASRPGISTRPDPTGKRVAGTSTLGNSVPATNKGHYRLVAIGTSTGGPVALQKVLSKLPANFPLPIVLVQHMPGTFTGAFAERLNGACKIKVKEAKDGDVLEPGTALLAPGGFQMLVDKVGAKQIVRIKPAESGQTYKPCVDITFDSIVKVEPARTLAIIMTGMGADGCQGSIHLKQGGSSVWAQDEASCVVFGMPGAVVEAGIADAVLDLDDIGTYLAERV